MRFMLATTMVSEGIINDAILSEVMFEKRTALRPIGCRVFFGGGVVAGAAVHCLIFGDVVVRTGVRTAVDAFICRCFLSSFTLDEMATAADDAEAYR
jgi:hypothetical protein